MANCRIEDHKHEKMKSFVKQGLSDTIAQEYDLAIEHWIAIRSGELIETDSKITEALSSRINNAENHLASMMGRTGVDTAMVLMALVMFLEQFYKNKYTREEIIEMIRKDGARYYTSTSGKGKGHKIDE